jgi:hypothetical protein
VKKFILLPILLWACPSWGQVPIYTGQYNVSRTSANLSETILTPANVNTSAFGLLFSRAVDAQIFAQPLYVPAVTINSTTQNVVYVATMNNSVYAFDADNPSVSTPLWQVNLGPPITIPSHYLSAQTGILSTPVIDPTSNTLYCVAATTVFSSAVYYLHALDITTGAEKFNGPVQVTGSVAGTAPDSVGGIVTLNTVNELQRSALLLVGGTVLISFAAIVEGTGTPTYHGWLIGYNAKTLVENFAYNTSPNSNGGGIWMSGIGPSVDQNGVYFAVGNGPIGNDSAGESVIRIGASDGYFIAANYATLNQYDWDLGAGGPMLIPGTNLLAIAGKTGELYLLTRTNLGKLQAGDDGAVQSFQASLPCSAEVYNRCYEIHHMTVWPRDDATSYLYIWPWQDSLKAFAFAAGVLNTTPASVNANPQGFPGGMLAISANGATNGILWAVTSATEYLGGGVIPTGILHAFDATNVATELWNSTMNSADGLGTLTKFSVPVVTNGKVYVATTSNALRVYGLK